MKKEIIRIPDVCGNIGNLKVVQNENVQRKIGGHRNRGVLNPDLNVKDKYDNILNMLDISLENELNKQTIDELQDLHNAT